MRQNLQRGLNPMVWLLPQYLFASALVTQCVALLIRLSALADIARGMHATATVVGLVALAVLLVDHLTTPVGSVAYRLRGLASGRTSVLVLGFTLAWYVRADGGTALPIFVIEVITFVVAVLGTRGALAALGAEDEPESWPFRPAQ